MEKLREYLFLFGFAGGIVAIDQWSKFQIRTHLALGEVWEPIPALAPNFRIVHWHNTGAAFGIFPSGGTVFTMIAIIVAAAIVYYFPRVPTDFFTLRMALGLQLGGAIGNLIDRVIQGTVTDFFAVGDFPVFNIADASISLGVAMLIGGMWLGDRSADQDTDEAKAALTSEDQPAEPERSMG